MYVSNLRVRKVNGKRPDAAGGDGAGRVRGPDWLGKHAAEVGPAVRTRQRLCGSHRAASRKFPGGRSHPGFWLQASSPVVQPALPGVPEERAASQWGERRVCRVSPSQRSRANAPGGRRTLGRHGDYRLRVGVSAKGWRATPPAQAMTARDSVANYGSDWRSRQQGRAAGGRPNPSTGPWRTVCGGSRPRPASPHRPCADCLRWP